MQKVRGKNTRPELIIRHLLQQLGYRGYRLHKKNIPGHPDISWINRKLAIFINGCFWHGHHCSRGARIPKTNKEYWTAKIERNHQRDLASQTLLESYRWRPLTIWECELLDLDAVNQKLINFFQSSEI